MAENERFGLGEGEGFSHRALAKLSGLNRAQVADFRRAWAGFGHARRLGLVRAMVEMAEDSAELDFADLFVAILDDPDADVRETAIEGLWEDERRATADRLLELARADNDPRVRAAAAGSLGRYLLELEPGKLDSHWGDALAEAVRAIAGDVAEVVPVRRRAIESLGYLGSARAGDLIEEAYHNPDVKMRASALHAMGRTVDPRWVERLVGELGGDEPELRFEAARALGELEEPGAAPALIAATRDPDREVRLAAIAALGKVGGRVAQQALQELRFGEDETTRTAAEEALEELHGTESPLGVRPREVHPN